MAIIEAVWSHVFVQSALIDKVCCIVRQNFGLGCLAIGLRPNL